MTPVCRFVYNFSSHLRLKYVANSIENSDDREAAAAFR
jgi:hypothetical protein